jgi:hypothetical protein
MLWSGYLQLAAVEPIASAVREGVAFFLCQTGVGRNTLRRTVVLAVGWCSIQVAIAVGMLTSNSSQNAAFWAPFMFWFTTDGSKVLLYFGLLIFWFRPSNERGHLSRNWVYGCAMFVYCMANLIGDLLMYFDVTACVILIAEIVYYCTWPVLTFLALNMDSKYWRNVGRPAWSASSSYTVVQRLSRSRSEFERIVDNDERDRAANHNRLANEHVIDFSRLRILRRIGKKTLNVELLAAFLDGHPVCMKRFHVEDLDARTLDGCVREVTIAACLPPHRNIAAMYGVTLLVPTICVVCEYAARGTLDDFLRQRLREYQVSRLTDPAAHATSSSSGPYARVNTRHNSLVSINGPPPPADGSPPPRPTRSAPPRRSSPATDERRPLLSGSVNNVDSPVQSSNGTLVVPIDDEQFRSMLTGYEGDDALSLSRLSVGDYGAIGGEPSHSSSEKLIDASAALDDSQFLPLRTKLELARDLSCGLAFLHAQKPAIVHSDVSSRNCLLANEAGQMRLMLTDFGTTRRLIANDMPAPTSRRWSTGSGRFGAEADVCGAGVILHELWTGRVPTSVELAVLQQRASSPAPSGSVPNLPSLLAADVASAVSSGLPPTPPPSVGTMPQCWIEVMNDCWRVARDRITAAQLEQRVFAMRIDRNETLVVPLQPTSTPPPAPDAVPEPTHVLQQQ